MHEQAPLVLDTLLDRQKQAWIEGSRPDVEEFLHDTALQNNTEVFLDLVYNEIVVREELGETPSEAEYIARYPHLQEDLKLHFEVHSALQEDLLEATRRVPEPESLPDMQLPLAETSPHLKDYELIAELGHGGMGIVYQARHLRLNRRVAVKMFHPGRFPSPRELLRFQTEAEAIARLQHPNIVQIFEVGQAQGLPYLALELAERETLAQKLLHFSFTPRAAAELVETLARAIHHAHERNILHRDLKPANVLFSRDGTPKITDFGLAKFLEEDEDSPRDQTRTGDPIGTPRYMAPEQAVGRLDLIGPATDIYGLGNLLYECLTGQVPFVASSVVETMEKIRLEEPRSPRQLQPSLPRDLATICLHCLHKTPQRRYASALALAEDLRRYLAGEPIQARPTPAWEHAWKWCRRRPAQATLAAVGVVLIVASLTAAGVQVQLEQRRLTFLREKVDHLVKQGQDAVERRDDRAARASFLNAWQIVLAEPSLHDHVLSVSGWLDHTRQVAEKQAWKQRRPPPLFDERRDEAFLQSVMLDPRQKDAAPALRRSIQAALAITVADDPAWRLERQQLLLLEADLLLRQGDAAAALALLDQDQKISSRLWHQRRTACLERLGRKPEADAERTRVELFPPADAFEFFLTGVDCFHQRDLNSAVSAFDQVLAKEPEHFAARLFQAVCFLQMKRPAEAKIALTACLGQRPRCVWSYLFRGEAYLLLQVPVCAAQDFQSALEMSPPEPARQHLDQALLRLSQTLESLPEQDRVKFWQEKIQADGGWQALHDLPAFEPARRK